MVKTDRPNIDFLLYTLSERPLSKLSENHKIYVIRPTVLKLWPNQRVLDDRLWYWDSFSCHNLKSMDPISTLLWFSESLERNLSNGIIKVHIWAIKLFANLATPWISSWSKAEKWQIMVPDFNTSFERFFSKLSENHKINVIGPTKLKLWPFKRCYCTTNSLPPKLAQIWCRPDTWLLLW